MTTPVEPANPAKACNASRDDLVFYAFLAFDEDRPILAFRESSARAAGADSSGLGDIEEQNSAWQQCVMDGTEELVNGGQRVAGVQEIVVAPTLRSAWGKEAVESTRAVFACPLPEGGRPGFEGWSIALSAGECLRGTFQSVLND